jgi:purine-binding chemotaxis protein CheW
MAIEILIFEVDDRRFGIRSRSVVEVVRAVTLSSWPAESAIADGLLNLRGLVLPVLDVRSLFDLPRRTIEHTDHLIVVESENRMAALRVDRATDLIRFEDHEIQSLSDTVRQMELVDVLAKTGDGIVHVLDIPRLLALDEAVIIDTAAGRGAREPSL